MVRDALPGPLLHVYAATGHAEAEDTEDSGGKGADLIGAARPFDVAGRIENLFAACALLQAHRGFAGGIHSLCYLAFGRREHELAEVGKCSPMSVFKSISLKVWLMEFGVIVALLCGPTIAIPVSSTLIMKCGEVQGGCLAEMPGKSKVHFGGVKKKRQ